MTKKQNWLAKRLIIPAGILPPAVNYQSSINAEINGPSGKIEELIAQIYGASSLLKFPIFKQTAVNFTQKHLVNSCQFLLKNI